MSSPLKNAAHLYLIQAANFILPLLVLPYLTRTLGPAKFGAIAFAQVMIQYALLVTEFGFGLSATRRIAMHRNDRAAITEIFWNTNAVRGAFACLSCAVILAVVYVVPAYRTDLKLVALAMVSVAGSLATPVWLFLGLQQMGILAVISLIPRICLLPAFFILVKRPEDYLVAAALQFSPSMLTGILAVAWIAWTRPIGWLFPCLRGMRSAAADGFHIFSAAALASIPVYSNGTVLRLMVGETEFGYYAAADRLVKAAQMMIGPAVQAVYPRVSAGGRVHLQGMYWGVFAVTGAFWLCCLVLGDFVVQMVFGTQFSASRSVLAVLALAPLLTGVASVAVTLRIIATGNHEKLKGIYAICAAFHVLQCILFIHFWGAVGAAASIILTEALATALIFRVAKGIRNENEP